MMGQRGYRHLFLAFFLVVSFVLSHPLPSQGQTVKVLMYDKEGKERCRFYVERAVTPEEQSRGLMFRKRLDQKKGMLFVFDREEIRSFWMRNTFIPLDMIFIDSSLTVVSVHRGAKPLDETVIESRFPARYVLEVNAGRAEECLINPGSKSRFVNLSK